jgi:ArsR family transcriptional regulator
MLETLKALADPSRLRLVAVLARGEFTVQELTAILGMGQSRISRHLKILTDAGILAVQRQGTWAYYRMGGDNRFFSLVRPILEEHLVELPERPADLDGLGRVMEARRRRSQEFFDRHARQWDSLAREVLSTAEYLDRLLESIPSCETLLEVGLGTGGLLAKLRERANRVIGVDHSPAMIEEARGRLAAEDLAGVELRLGEMSHLPLPDGECDVALLNMVLHHAARPFEVLNELNRVLSSRGVLVIADLVAHRRDWVRERLADQWLGFEADELSSWLAAAGFAVQEHSVVEEEGEALGVFILRARKIV